MVVGFCGTLLFFFVPESYWDRTPVPKSRKQSKNGSRFSLFSYHRESHTDTKDSAVGTSEGNNDYADLEKIATSGTANGAFPKRPALAHRQTPKSALHVGFAPKETRHGNGEDGAVDHGSPISEGALSPLGVASPGKL
jgi:hypothetical protein